MTPDITSILILFLSGLIAGFLAGFFGIGGGVILVLILIHFYQDIGMDADLIPKVAVATSLFTIIFTTISSTVKHFENRNIEWRLTFIIGLASIFSALIGSKIGSIVPGSFIKRFFSIVLLASAMRMLLQGNLEDGMKIKASPPLEINPMLALFWGFVVGLVSSLAGVGGGILLVPVMHHLMKVPIKRAIGTSSSIIIFTSLFATIGYIINGLNNPGLSSFGMLGFVDYKAGIPILIGSILTGRAGADISFKTKTHFLRKAFALLLVFMAIRIFFK